MAPTKACPVAATPKDRRNVTSLVIVESPAKAKTINKYLGSAYKVLASYGHVRDLPAKDGSVRPDEGFAMDWTADAASTKRLREITDAAKASDAIYLATDPDREGEAISWHVFDVLKKRRVLKDKPVRRVVFNAITKKAVTDAMAAPRDIDAPLVEAYLARRALDYLVGFNLSPVLWRKLPGSRSAGRVQSVALRLVCEREDEIDRFVPQEYWRILAHMRTEGGDPFIANLASWRGKRVQRLDVKTEEHAREIEGMLKGATFRVGSVEAKPTKRNPGPPFTTSTLQQAASSRLGFAPARTMQVAQRLYEGIGEMGGLITYMRTDGVQMAPEAIDGARAAIEDTLGERFVADKPRHYSSKAKNAQEAHEAIRPTDFFRQPKDVAAKLDSDQLRLYELIWQRAIASQMAAAEIDRTTVTIEASRGSDEALLRATGSVIRFDGFLRAYRDMREEAEDAGEKADDDKSLPAMREGETPTREKVEATQHFTEPPPRYSEASLIKRMEELGIGRPSTYAATMKTLQDREYVTVDKRQLRPEPRGRVLTGFLDGFFDKYVAYDFTADLEGKLDSISNGDLEWRSVLEEFWREFVARIAEVMELRNAEVIDHLNEALAPMLFPDRGDDTDPRCCPRCGTGQLSLKPGRKFGPFIGCSNYPECQFTRQLDGELGDDTGSDGPKVLGADLETGEDVTLRSGRFGPYVQLGEGKEAKRSSIPKGWDVSDVDLGKALTLLALPREVGTHPETGQVIEANFGRYGPYLRHDGKYVNLPNPEDVFEIGLNRAVVLIAEKQAKGGGRGAAAEPLKQLGDHPDGGPVNVLAGRYGPYVKWEKVNATLPKDVDPKDVTLEQALALIEAKAAKGGAKGGRKKAPAKKAPARKSAKKATSGKTKKAEA